jgi:hypothetical protein
MAWMVGWGPACLLGAVVLAAVACMPAAPPCAQPGCEAGGPAPVVPQADAGMGDTSSPGAEVQPPVTPGLSDAAVTVPVPGDEPAFPDGCPPLPAARHAGAAVAALRFAPTLADKAISLGDWVDVAGRRIRLSTLRFFVSHVVLRRSGAAPVLGELVDGAGKLQAHGVHLIDLDDPASLVLRVRAPAGEYDQVAFRIGLPPSCNVGNPAAAVSPLNADGGMTWTWGFGYILVKIEGSEQAATPGAMSKQLSAHGGMIPPTNPPPRVVVSSRLVLPGPAEVVLRARFDDLVGVIRQEDGHLTAGFAVIEKLASLSAFVAVERP